MLLSLPTWQSFSTRKIASECINSCKLTLTFIHTYTYVRTVHIQHSLQTIFNPLTYSLNPPLMHRITPQWDVYLHVSGAYCTTPQSYTGYNTIPLQSHCFSFSCVHTLQTLAEEQSKRVKELSEELTSVQEELDQQRRLNETLVRRKVFSWVSCSLCFVGSCKAHT